MSHHHQSGYGSQNTGNSLGSRSCIRQSRTFRRLESGNAMKGLLGHANLSWDENRKEGAYSGQALYDADRGINGMDIGFDRGVNKRRQNQSLHNKKKSQQWKKAPIVSGLARKRWEEEQMGKATISLDMGGECKHSDIHSSIEVRSFVPNSKSNLSNAKNTKNKKNKIVKGKGRSDGTFGIHSFENGVQSAPPKTLLVKCADETNNIISKTNTQSIPMNPNPNPNKKKIEKPEQSQVTTVTRNTRVSRNGSSRWRTSNSTYGNHI